MTPDAERKPIHRRTIVMEAFEEGDEIRVECRLTDERPHMTINDGTLHDVALTVTVQSATNLITSARAAMSSFPHAECRSIEDHFSQLEGVSVGRGYLRAVQERFAGPNGCSHLDQLARDLGPMVMQAMTAHKFHDNERAGVSMADKWSPKWLRNTCHIWADEGPGIAKARIGWRPGLLGSEFPNPPVEEIKRRIASGEL
ncbi:MAG: DUF2889 domain-containing protein, partial [Acidimicrobiia bacterium]